MADKEYEYVPEYQDDEDDKRFYSKTTYNEHHYIEKEQELIRDSNAEIEDESREKREELEEYLLSLSPREYIEWKREFREEAAKRNNPHYDFDTKEVIISVN